MALEYQSTKENELGFWISSFLQNRVHSNKGNFDPGANAWCSSMVTSAACEGGGNDLVCYKEIWNVDGVTSK